MNKMIKGLEAKTMAEAIINMLESQGYDPHDCIIFDDNGNIESYEFQSLITTYTYVYVNGHYMMSTMDITQIGHWEYRYGNNGMPIMAITPWSISIGNDCISGTLMFVEEFTRTLNGGTPETTEVGRYHIPDNAAMVYPTYCKNDFRVFIGEDLDKFTDGRHMVKLCTDEDGCYLKISKIADYITMIRAN